MMEFASSESRLEFGSKLEPRWRIEELFRVQLPLFRVQLPPVSGAVVTAAGAVTCMTKKSDFEPFFRRGPLTIK